MVPHKAKNELLRQLLKAARVNAGLRQIDVANSLQVPQSYIAKVEQGERKISFIEVLSLCKALGIDPTELVRRLE